MGVDVPRFLNATEEMVHACSATVPVEENPGVVLGAILGTIGVRGRDKVTIITSPGISDLGAWLEQLIAESTGKIGKGLVPVDRERLGKPEVYGKVEGPGTQTVSLGLAKVFKVTEGMRLRFESTFTNVLNHTNFAPPATQIDNTATFGVLSAPQTAENAGNRTGQLALRIEF